MNGFISTPILLLRLIFLISFFNFQGHLSLGRRLITVWAPPVSITLDHESSVTARIVYA